MKASSTACLRFNGLTLRGLFRILLFGSTISTVSCGETTEPATHDAGEQVGVENKPRPANEPERCEVVGEMRDARDDEPARRCVCEAGANSSPYWLCYGPDPVSPEPYGGVGGSQPVRCSPGGIHHRGPAGQAACMSLWGVCTDGRGYGISCTDTDCVCFVNDKLLFTLEPGATCPDDVETLNRLCGWSIDLQ